MSTRPRRPARLVAFRCAAAGHEEGPDWSFEEHEVVRWCRLVSAAGGPCGPEDLRLVRHDPVNGHHVVHPGAASTALRWPQQRWRAGVPALVDDGHAVVITGNGTELDLCAGVIAGLPRTRNLAGRLSVSALADLISGAALVLAGDTGPAHLATAFGSPSVLLFGPTSPARWGPVIDLDRHVVLWHAGTGIGDPHADELDPALDRIDVSEVVAAAFELLARPEPQRAVAG